MTLGDELAATYERYVRQVEAAGSLDEALDVLAALARLEAAVRNHTARLVDDCRSLQASWAEIGEALGMTRQSAHARFAHRERDVRPE